METGEYTEPAPWGGQRRAMGFSALVGLLLAGTSLLLPVVPYPVESAATLGMVATLVAFVLFRVRDRRLDWFEVLLPVGVLYIVYFGVGTLHMKVNPGRLFGPSLEAYVTPAMWVAVVGFVAMLLGYGTLFRRTRPSPALAVEPTGAGLVVLGTLGGLGTAGAILQIALVMSGGQVSALFSLLNQFSPLFYLTWGIAWYMFFAGRLDAKGKLVLFGLLVPMAALAILATFGGKQSTILILIVPLIARWYARRTMPWVGIAALMLVAVFVVFPLYNTYRTQRRDLGNSARLDRAITSATRWSADEYMENSAMAVLDRMAIVSSLAAILRDVPDTVDYRYGGTLILAPVSLLIPRFLWPDKPIITIGREFGETFLLVSSWDRETLIAPSFVGDFYWNFALPGVVVGMLLFGGGLRWYYQRYGAGFSYDPMRKATYMALLSIATGFEGNVAAVAGAMTKTIVIILVTTYGLRRLGLVRELQPGD